MNDFEKTVYGRDAFNSQAAAEKSPAPSGGTFAANSRNARIKGDRISIVIFDGSNDPYVIAPGSFGKSIISFGRSADNDIRLDSELVSGHHGRISLDTSTGHWIIEDKGNYESSPSANGIIFNGLATLSGILHPGYIYRIDYGKQALKTGVMLLVTEENNLSNWQRFSLSGYDSVSIGRNAANDFALPYPGVANFQAKLFRSNGGMYIAGSGVLVNGVCVDSEMLLGEKDLIKTACVNIVYTSDCLFCSANNGFAPVMPAASVNEPEEAPVQSEKPAYTVSSQSAYSQTASTSSKSTYTQSAPSYAAPSVPRKSKMTALILSVLLGALGVDRFYLGYGGMGALKLLTGGLFGILYIIDIVNIATGRLEPADGYGYDEDFTVRSQSAQTSASPYDELEKLARLHEQGVLNDAEYDRMKADILSRMGGSYEGKRKCLPVSCRCSADCVHFGSSAFLRSFFPGADRTCRISSCGNIGFCICPCPRLRCSFVRGY